MDSSSSRGDLVGDVFPRVHPVPDRFEVEEGDPFLGFLVFVWWGSYYYRCDDRRVQEHFLLNVLLCHLHLVDRVTDPSRDNSIYLYFHEIFVRCLH